MKDSLAIRGTFEIGKVHHQPQNRHAIQELLGHQSLSTTQKYTHASIRQLMDIYDKSPLHT